MTPVTGGEALNVGIRKAFEEELMKDVYAAGYSQFNGAIGAAFSLASMASLVFLLTVITGALSRKMRQRLPDVSNSSGLGSTCRCW